MDRQIAINQDQSDRYLAAVAAAGQALIAVRSGTGVSQLGIRKMDDGDEETYQGFCEPRRFRGPLSTLRFLLAGEAAQVALGLCEFHEVSTLSTHCEAADVIRRWESYWGSYPHFYSANDQSLVDEVEEEISAVISGVRWQMRRRFRYDPERSAIESLAEMLRDNDTLTGVQAERFVLKKCRKARAMTESGIPILR